MKGLLALSFVIINVACDSSVDLVDVCSNSSNYDSYINNVTQNCGCKDTNSCVRKCCQKGFYLYHHEDPDENIFESVCIKNTSNVFNVPVHNGHEHVLNLTEDDNFLIGMLNCKNVKWQYFQMNNTDRRERFYVQKNGSLYYPFSKHRFYNNDRYCIDEQDGLTAFLCYTPENPSRSVARTINALGMAISMPFLLLTFLVFAVVSNGSLHRRALMFYCLSLFLAYAFLVLVMLYTQRFKPSICQTAGYSIIFFFMASFFWMNILCFDIWFAFGGVVKFNREQKLENKRFVLYCLYAWGLPLIHVIIVFLINKYTNANSQYYPGVGEGRCFLKENLPTFIYFYGPLTVIIGLNIILFLMTSLKIHKINKDTVSFRLWNTKRNSYEYDKRKFNLYLKLLLAMGINWSLEIVSWAVQLKQEQRENKQDIFFIWYISDFCNAIYGFIIFMIFVYRKAVWTMFKKRILVLCISCCNKSYEVEELEKSQEARSRTTTITEKDMS